MSADADGRWSEVCLYRCSPFVPILLDPSSPRLLWMTAFGYATVAKTHSLVMQSRMNVLRRIQKNKAVRKWQFELRIQLSAEADGRWSEVCLYR